MLDPALCTRPASQWLFLKYTISSWLMTPTLVLLLVTGLIFLPWMFPRMRWKRQLIRLVSVLFVIYLFATFPLTTALANKGLVAFVPQDPGLKVDAIVVLGRGYDLRPSRIKVAAQLWQANRAPLIFASGAGDAAEIVNQLKSTGIPNSALAQEDCSRTTEENGVFTATVLRPQGIKKILLVTDPPHMLRSLMTFNSLGFKAYPHYSPLPSNLAPTEKAMLIFYEYIGLASYSLKGFLLPQNMAKGETTPTATPASVASLLPLTPQA